METTGEAGETVLWQLGLDWLCEVLTGSTHWLDEDRAYRLAQGMHAVGERPDLREVRGYVREAWGEEWRWSGEMVLRAWKTVHRRPHRMLRGQRWRNGYLYQVDWLIQRHELRPVTEGRLAAVAEAAVADLAVTLRATDWEAYSDARSALDSALSAIDQLRALRLPEIDGQLARRPKWW